MAESKTTSFGALLKGRERLPATVALVAVVSLASWMGYGGGGYFVRSWAVAALLLAGLALILSLSGVLRPRHSRWSLGAAALFALYAVWTALSLLWSPNRGDAWLGLGQTLLYLPVFWISTSLVGSGASRRWVLAASSLGPAVVTALMLPALVPSIRTLFADNRLIGTVGYYNGEAAFLLFPFWVSVYLAGSRRVNPFLRGAVLAGATLCVEVAVLTQSRGAMVAMAASAPVFFLLSGKRLRGLLALAPLAVALFLTFPGLNRVYLEFLGEGSPAAALDRALPVLWLTVAGAGLYGLLWGLVDRRWTPSAGVVRTAGGVALVAAVVVLAVGAYGFLGRVGDPLSWTEQKWEAFKSNDISGYEQSRYLSSSGSGRYTLWQVAWNDFASHPLKGVGTQNYEATYYRERDRSAGYARQPHSLPLEVLAERGVVGGVLFFGFLTACLAAGLRSRFGRLGGEAKAQIGALFGAVAYWFVHSGAEWFWQFPGITLPAMVYLAILATPWRARATAPARWTPRMFTVGLATLVVAVVTPLYVSDRYLTRSYETTNPWEALQAVEQARRYNPLNPQLPQREAELAIRIGDWPRVVESYKEAIRLNPEHYAPYTLLARFYDQIGEPNRADTLYRKASSLNPLDKEVRQRISHPPERAGRSNVSS